MLPAIGFKHFYVANQIYDKVTSRIPFNKGDTLKFMKKDDVTVVPLHIEVVMSYSFGYIDIKKTVFIHSK